jgi:hypothetical protein
MPDPATFSYVTEPLARTVILDHIVPVPTIFVRNFRIAATTFSGAVAVHSFIHIHAYLFTFRSIFTDVESVTIICGDILLT